ncbi:MAG: hypothetical protein IPF98_08030 [Gemmatimonadetes bacterium]|nr:hypothetical protein [Gemmatimonadota bacterium]MCC6769798.1 hypothetical protein [Gemmatimonadaceae bacterium]
MHSQLQLIRNADLGYILKEQSEIVGWIQQGIVGLAGYPSRVDAYFAADAAASTLRDWSLGREVSLPVPFPRPLAPDERVRVDDRVVGRLVPPFKSAAFGAAGYGFEIAVPADTWLSVMLELAQRLRENTAEWRRLRHEVATPLDVA